MLQLLAEGLQGPLDLQGVQVPQDLQVFLERQAFQDLWVNPVIILHMLTKV